MVKLYGKIWIENMVKHGMKIRKNTGEKYGLRIWEILYEHSMCSTAWNEIVHQSMKNT